MSNKVVLFGDGPIARLAYRELAHDSAYDVAAFCLDRDFIKEDELFGVPVIPFDDIEKAYPPENHKMFIAIGFAQVNRVREERYLHAKKLGYKFLNIIAKTAITYPCLDIGDNCFIGHFTEIAPDVRIGNNVFIGSGCTIAHDTELGDNCFLSDQIAISGWTKVMKNCFFGTSATVRNKVTIGQESVIGAATVIMENVDERSVYFCESSKKLNITSDRLKL